LGIRPAPPKPFTVAITTETILSGPAFKPEELTEKDEALLARYYGFLKN